MVQGAARFTSLREGGALSGALQQGADIADVKYALQHVGEDSRWLYGGETERFYYFCRYTQVFVQICHERKTMKTSMCQWLEGVRACQDGHQGLRLMPLASMTGGIPEPMNRKRIKR